MKQTKPTANRFRRFITVLMMVITVVLGLGLLVSGYAGYVDPADCRYAGFVELSFSIWLYALIAVIIIDAFVARHAAISGAVFFIAALPVILDYSPLNISEPKPGEGEREIKLQTYNVLGFYDQNKEYHGDINRTVSYIINSGADVVCLQEALPIVRNVSLHITDAQVDSIHSIYPYIYLSGWEQMILSKFPVEPVRTDFRCGGSGEFDLGVFRLNIDGCKITVFNVHLKSMDLTLADREVYEDFSRFKNNDNIKEIKNNIKEVKQQVLGKVVAAGVARAADMPSLLKYIEHYGGPNAIVCGDFNDVAWSYSIRRLESAGFRQAYRHAAFGPMITYNSNNLFFRIDHILYRGRLEPVSVSRGRLKTSDHYPFEATFIIKKQ